MPTIQVGPDSSLELQAIADAFGKSRKVVVVTGAGISTNCGIPDFRSENGLYSMIQAQYDAAVKNPPWEDTNTHDIDDRPKKRRKPWYFYEVVAPSGQVVDVVGGAIEDSTQTPKSSRSRPNSPVNPQTISPGNSSDSSGLSDPPDHLSEPDWSDEAGNTTTIVKEQLSPIQSRRSSRRVQDFPGLITPSSVSTSSLDLSQQQPSSDSTPTDVDDSTITDRSISPTDSSQIQSSPSPDNLTPSQQSQSQPSALPRSIQTLKREESSNISNNSDDNEPSTQSSQASRSSLPNLKGRDLFDSMVWADAFTTSIFYMFISSLRQKILEVKETTETHKFIKVLRDGGRLVRNYTQNIDCFEEREGLVTELSRGPGNRSRFNPKTQREPRPAEISGDSAHCGGVEVVLLHGSLGELRCGICARLSEWDEERGSVTSQGRAPDCPSCLEAHAKRTGKGRRGLAVGRLRPNIVLYGEEHPHAALVSPLVTHDLGLSPDVLLIMGTSLRVHGLKVMVKEFAKAIHMRGGKVVFVNRTKPSESTWGDVIDYWVEWDCDEWVVDLRKRRGDIWLPQGSVEDKRQSTGEGRSKSLGGSSRDSGDLTQPKKKQELPRCTRDDRINGVYVMFKILDTLRSAEDDNGSSTRKQYWVPRTSTAASNTASKKASGGDVSFRKEQRKSLPKTQSISTVAKSKKRKSTAPAISEDQTKVNFELTKRAFWQGIINNNPSLPRSPPEISHAILREHCANIPSTAQQFAFKADSNHLPNLGWGSFPTLISHPPTGALEPIHSKSIQPPPSRAPPTHSYGTRAAQSQIPSVLPAVSSMVVGVPTARKPYQFPQSFMVLDTESRIPTPPKSDPQTPTRSRDMSIGALLSGGEEEVPTRQSSTDVSEEFHDAVEVMDQ